MPSFLVHAHGMIQGGSGWAANPKFIVPANTTIYFFCHHRSSMLSGSLRWLADLMLKMLLGPAWTMENERAVREDACEVFRDGDLCPNYYTETRSELDFPSTGLANGVYQVGGGAQPTCARPLAIGHTVTLQPIVSGVGCGGSMGNHFYWNCCREALSEPKPQQRKYMAGFGGSLGTHVSNITGTRTSTSTRPWITPITDLNYKTLLERLMRHIRTTGTMFKDSGPSE